MLALVFSAESG